MKKISVFLMASLAAVTPAFGVTPMPKARPATSCALSRFPTAPVTVDAGTRGMLTAMRNVQGSNSTFIPEIHGNVLWPTNVAHYLTMSVLPSEPNGSFVAMSPSGLAANGGGVMIGDTYWCGSILSGEGYEEYMLFSFDGQTWEQLSYEALNPDTQAGLMATDVAVNPVDGKVYGCFYSDDGQGAVFGTIDYLTKVRLEIAPLQTSWSGCAFDAQGNLYAVDYYGKLLEVDTQTGEMTEIGETGLQPTYLSSACIDPRTGRMFYSYNPSDETTYLYEINTATAAATMLYQFPANEEIVGMYIPSPRADYNAPAAVSEAVATFTAGSLQGDISFDAPVTTYGGDTAEGSLSYTIRTNNTEIATGHTTYGAHVTAPVAMQQCGNYTFSITVANSVGSSPAVEITEYVGHDTPIAPTVTATLSGSDIEISWNAVATGINGGYVDADNVTYTVTRLNDNVVIAQDITTTTVTDTPEQPESQQLLTYGVTAKANGMTSEQGVSNNVPIGPILPPYVQDFSSPDTFSTLTIIDANNDGNAWYHYKGDGNPRARIRYNSTKAMDDWLITPAIRLEAGKIYVMHFDVAKEGGAVNVEKIEVKYGTSNTVEAMTLTALEPTTVTDNTLTTVTCRIEATETANYYIGFHGCSDKDKFWLNLDNIVLEAGAIASAPDQVSNFEVTPGSYGRHTAEIAFNVPTTDFDGNALTQVTSAQIRRNGDLIYTVDSPAPGQLVLFTDQLPAGGEYTYTATASNASGEGKPLSITKYIGTKTPVAPRNVAMAEDAESGQVTVTWNAPDKDVEGNVINPAAITYNVIQILDGNQSVVATAHAATSLQTTPLQAGEHKFVTYAVIAESEGGLSEPAVSPTLPVGTPYALPYEESFANGESASIFLSITEMGAAQWGLFTDSSIAGVSAADSDNGYAAMEGTAYNDRASLVSGKIDLRNAIDPVLTFKVFNMCGSTSNTNPLEVLVNDGTGFRSLGTYVMEDTGDVNQWNEISIPLSSCIGHQVSVKLYGKVDVYKYIMIDDMRLYDASTGVFETGINGNIITTSQGMIHVDGCSGEAITVINPSGQLVVSLTQAPATATIKVAPGIYIVKAGTHIAKVAVR